MKSKHIAAFTEVTPGHYPAYLSINQETDGTFMMVARERGGKKEVKFEVPESDLRNLADAIIESGCRSMDEILGQKTKADIYGPSTGITRSCFNCPACTSERYSVQGDSGHFVSCAHPAFAGEKEGRRYIDDTKWNTPSWCPAAV